MKKSKAVIGVLCGILAVALVVASVMVQIYGGRRQEAKANKKTTTLVVYFSATGTTKKAARKVKKATKGKLYRIKAAQPYTREDLDYYTKDNCRAQKEQNDDNARPEIAGSIKNMSEYETIYIGYPIWWGKEPKIIRTFLESYDLRGKKIIPFCTSGGSGISGSMSEIRESAKGANVIEGKDLTEVSLKSVKKWTKSIGK